MKEYAARLADLVRLRDNAQEEFDSVWDALNGMCELFDFLNEENKKLRSRVEYLERLSRGPMARAKN